VALLGRPPEPHDGVAKGCHPPWTNHSLATAPPQTLRLIVVLLERWQPLRWRRPCSTRSKPSVESKVSRLPERRAQARSAQKEVARSRGCTQGIGPPGQSTADICGPRLTTSPIGPETDGGYSTVQQELSRRLVDGQNPIRAEDLCFPLLPLGCRFSFRPSLLQKVAGSFGEQRQASRTTDPRILARSFA